MIRRYGLSARKRLGQHFLLDLNLTRRIARSAGAIDSGTVIEIGPGPGGLTRALLMEGARRVIAVEADSRCLGALAEIAAAWPDRLEAIAADALEIDAAVGTTFTLDLTALLAVPVAGTFAADDQDGTDSASLLEVCSICSND